MFLQLILFKFSIFGEHLVHGMKFFSFSLDVYFVTYICSANESELESCFNGSLISFECNTRLSKMRPTGNKEFTEGKVNQMYSHESKFCFLVG